MKDSKLDESLRSAKPEIQPKGAFTAQVMERIEAVQASRRRPRLANARIWAATITAVFAVIAVLAISPNSQPNNRPSDQVAVKPPSSQTDVGIDRNADDTNTSGHSQLAQQVQEDIDAINSGISSIDSTEYSDSGLSEAALSN